MSGLTPLCPACVLAGRGPLVHWRKARAGEVCGECALPPICEACNEAAEPSLDSSLWRARRPGERCRACGET